jgi:hypothetical protein
MQPYQIELPGPITTSPITVALGATKASAAMSGVLPENGKMSAVIYFPVSMGPGLSRSRYKSRTYARAARW